MELSLTDLEAAINYWRALRPSSGEEQALSREVNSLANLYAMMIVSHSKSVPLESIDAANRDLLAAWQAQRAG